MMKKITIIVNGRFHAFDYAAELQKRGLLHRLISTMPNSRARKFNVSQRKYIGLPLFEVVKVIWRTLFKKEPPTVLYAKVFTKVALFFVPSDSDIVISFAGYTEEIFQSKKLKNALKILDRSSTHTLSNIKLKQSAAEYHGVSWTSHPNEFIERELSEYCLADKILLPSTFVKHTFLENGVSEDKIIQIPYAFSNKKFDLSREIPTEKRDAVLFVGQLSPRKGVGVLIDAMKIVRQTYPDYKLWLVGALTSSIDVRMIESDWISYKGILRGDDLFEVYATASVFCLPSFEEGLAYVLTEANYINLPIVATPNSGIEDVIRNDNEHYITPAGEPELLAIKLIEAINSTKKNNKSRNLIGNSQQIIPMTWEKYCDKLLASVHNG